MTSSQRGSEPEMPHLSWKRGRWGLVLTTWRQVKARPARADTSLGGGGGECSPHSLAACHRGLEISKMKNQDVCPKRPLLTCTFSGDITPQVTIFLPFINFENICLALNCVSGPVPVTKDISVSKVSTLASNRSPQVTQSLIWEVRLRENNS